MYDFDSIREHYTLMEPHIFEVSKREIQRWVSPYCSIDWPLTFSPIEMATWGVIRSYGRAPLYPQYPVGRYFVDFGNPVVKVALECDGKEWHTDKAKDLRRDTKLRELGWKVFRIGGAECFRVCEQIEELREYNEYSEQEKYNIVKEFYSETVDGLIRAISIFYFGHNRYFVDGEIKIAYDCLRLSISIPDDEALEEIYQQKLQQYYNAIETE